MPLTPSIGLSVLVHLIVLLISGLRRLFRSKKQKRRAASRGRRTRSPALVNRFLGMLIPFTISVVIFSGAFKLVELSVKNRFSSVLLAQRYISALQAKESDTSEISLASEQSVTAAYSDDPALVKNVNILETSTSHFNCLPLFNHFANQYGWSVVNYLVAHDAPHALSDREALAHKLNVSAYNASNEKNIELLKALFLEYNDGQLTDTNACKLFIANN